MERRVDFFKIDGNVEGAGGGGPGIFVRKEGYGKTGGLPYFIEVFLEIPHDEA